VVRERVLVDRVGVTVAVVGFEPDAAEIASLQARESARTQAAT